MGATRWTNSQEKTIAARGSNVLVSAAAGSGKTAVLTERILRLMTVDRVPINELLVVTFTEAAAREMKTRIADKLTVASENDAFAQLQLRRLDGARIMTLHAFCLTIIKRYFYAIEIDPSFQVADEKRAAALREDALDEMLAAAFADNDADFRAEFTAFLYAHSGARDERKVREIILNVYEFIMALPDPFSWLSENVEALSASLASSDALSEIPAIRFADEEIARRLARALALIESVGALLDARGLPALATKNAKDLETVMTVERLFLSGDREGTRRAIDSISFERFQAGKAEKDAYEEIRELVKLRRDRVKDILKKEVGAAFFAKPAAAYAEEIARVLPYARTLEALVKRFAETYDRLKRAENVIDFADFEHLALRILAQDDIAGEYRRRLSYIFVDEYQDSNDVQEALINRVARGNNVFMVGDVKQSIYGFRNATPELFLEKSRLYPPEETDGAAGLRINLSENFRSKIGVIDAVNAAFETIMEPQYSGMAYDEDARLVAGVIADDEAVGGTFLHLIKKDKEKENYDNDAEAEAAVCAKIIQETVGKPFFDAKKGEWREARYGDVAILLRAAKGAADIYRRTLEARGIPAITDRGEGYFETVEIDTLLALLRAIVNPRRDVPLAAALCSAAFGFELSELAEIRAACSDGLFNAAFLSYASGGADDALREKCARAKDRLAEWRDEERFMRLDAFLWKLMRESGFYDYAKNLRGGAARQANLRALLDRAADFQRGRVEGLREFLTFLERVKKRGGAPTAAAPIGGEDVCRIMTIHGSKGLEFPFVLLGGLGKSFQASGAREDSLTLHRRAGLSLYWTDTDARAYGKTLIHTAIKLRRKIDERAELIRLLYVGMTRAMDTLHLIGTMSDPQKLIDLYGDGGASSVIDTDVIGASNYLQLLLPIVLKRGDLFRLSVISPEDSAEEGCVTGSEAKRCGCADDAPPSDIAPIADEIYEAEVPFVYPHLAAAKLKSKYSVTALGKLGRPDDAPVFFMAGSGRETEEDAGLSAAERGTALHTALERLDFREARSHRDDPAWFEACVAKLAASGVSGAETVSAEVLLRFSGSELLARAAEAPFLAKEVPFNMKLPYGEALRIVGGLDGAAPDEEIVIQGVIDCLFEEADGWVIADYKTGHFDAGAYEREAERVRQRYGAQLRLYRRAAELIFGKPVKESFIYMTRAGLTVEIPE